MVALIHDRLVPAVVASTAVAFVLNLVFNGLGGAGYEALFPLSVGDISAKYEVYITPAGWTFSIWSLIFILQAAGLVYSVSTIFRSVASVRLYTMPPVLGWTFYSVMTVNYILNTIWIFIWLYEYVVGAAIVLLFIAYTAWLAIGIACYNGKQAMDQMESGSVSKLMINEVRIQRALIHNGLAVYATWTVIASLLNLNIAFQYIGHYDAEITSLVCCALLLSVIIVWFILENTVFDKYVRYMVTQYPVVIFASGGIVDNLSRKQEAEAISGPIPASVTVITWTILAISSALFLARLAIVAYRYRCRPLYPDVKLTEDHITMSPPAPPLSHHPN